MKRKSPISLIRKQMEKENRSRPARLMPVPKEQWPEAGRLENMVEVWLSNRYMAQVFNEGEGVLRVSVCRTSIDAAGLWEQNLSWDELMEIKRQICHSDSYAVEVLPPDPDIVNVANLRHFWILPEPVIGWSRSASVKEGA